MELLLELLAIPGRSGEEGAVAATIVSLLQRGGVPPEAIQHDTAHKKSPRGGEVGNLIVRLPGTVRGPRRLLMAHIDTVPLCLGAQPVLRRGRIVSSNRSTALGGDDRAGAAVVLHTALSLLAEGLPHPPLTLLWTVQEEVGLIGARYVAVSRLGQPAVCFNWDGGLPEGVVLGATGGDHLDLVVHGVASHAGAHPEDGVSAIAIAGLAIADLQRQGWLGRIQKGRSTGTSNIGVVSGGEATNVVTDCVRLQAEARSHDARFRQRIVTAYQDAFVRAAASVKNAAGTPGRVELTVQHKYESFRIPETSLCVQEACAAIRVEGLEPVVRIIDGGVDANWMTAHGLPTVTLGCGQDGIHTVDESLHVESYRQACRIARRLATLPE